ncbi:class I SAM-dependent methyltransferase [Halorubrum salinarum]|uniref:Class I SAM-dependent methyltransferase n=1 Tax=Halorubrum salinarum TaxID=2739057 RepID=A0A7D3YFT3_9EURY|nr:class I SAM-dependent methyltransferase [Halorubrum salinarum]QKG94088.1 class I SAM-dependent methyltransferase [Halorubrum salinarum]
MTDAFGRAIRDHHRGERTAPLRQGDGEETREHPIEAFYFTEFDPESDAWLASRLDGPLVDLGAGAGRHALRFQERFETVAVESSPALVETMRERGVADAREGDMFALREAFERDRFAAAIAIGTQIGLAGSMRGLSAFLGDLAFVTTPDATAVVDCYDPDHPEAADLLGYREDPTPGLAGRVMWFAYDGERDPTLRFTLFSPDRLREAAIGTGWTVEAVDRSGSGEGPHYRAALRKR